MDEEYIVAHLLDFCKVMYGKDSEPFAKYSKRREVYIFGCIQPFGVVVKSIVHRSVAIYLSVGVSPKIRRNERR